MEHRPVPRRSRRVVPWCPSPPSPGLRPSSHEPRALSYVTSPRARPWPLALPVPVLSLTRPALLPGLGHRSWARACLALSGAFPAFAVARSPCPLPLCPLFPLSSPSGRKGACGGLPVTLWTKPLRQAAFSPLLAHCPTAALSPVWAFSFCPGAHAGRDLCVCWSCWWRTLHACSWPEAWTHEGTRGGRVGQAGPGGGGPGPSGWAVHGMPGLRLRPLPAPPRQQ